jgi:hypothetical protein
MIDWFLNLIGWGNSYEVSWFGEVNASNGWGIVYPFDADGSFLRVSTTLESTDTTYITTDQTKY